MDTQDVVVIGAGVVGLAIARELALRGRDVLVIEKAASFGTETSSRNSEVIHSGIYYADGSVKARTCVQGVPMLYEYCDSRSVPCRRIGKLIVATDHNEEQTLEIYLAQGEQNGVQGLILLNQHELAEREPAVHGVAALWSPNTGIIDSHSFMFSLLCEFEKNNGQIVYKTEVVNGKGTTAGTELTMHDGYALLAKTVVNVTGLYASDVSANLGVDSSTIPVTRYARGRYYTYSAKSPFNHLVYPIASKAGLGVHATLDMAGQLRFGPDVEWISRVDYSFDGSVIDDFSTAIKRYFPALKSRDLQEGYTGVRPKVVGKGDDAGDFIIHTPEETNCPGVYALYGIESPGLTASLALSELLGDMICQ